MPLLLAVEHWGGRKGGVMTGPDQGRLLWVNGDRDPSHAYRVHSPSIEADGVVKG